MLGETNYKITIDYREITSIGTLLEILDDCPIPLNNDDYVSIFRAIANHSKNADDVDGIEFSYVEGDPESDRKDIESTVLSTFLTKIKSRLSSGYRDIDGDWVEPSIDITSLNDAYNEIKKELGINE